MNTLELVLGMELTGRVSRVGEGLQFWEVLPPYGVGLLGLGLPFWPFVASSLPPVPKPAVKIWGLSGPHIRLLSTG